MKKDSYSDADSGLECKFHEWEQKFISGIDPTIAWQDITMVLRCYTSRSDTYGLSEKFETKLKTWINTPDRL
jgi:hypothetical protein